MAPAMPGRVGYPVGHEPNYWNPVPASPTHRFMLGRLLPSSAGNPLVAIGMNSSHATENYSDRTVNRIILASTELDHAGWAMLNLYPERASSPSDLRAFSQSLSDANCDALKLFIERYQVNEILAA